MKHVIDNLRGFSDDMKRVSLMPSLSSVFHLFLELHLNQAQNIPLQQSGTDDHTSTCDYVDQQYTYNWDMLIYTYNVPCDFHIAIASKNIFHSVCDHVT